MMAVITQKQNFCPARTIALLPGVVTPDTGLWGRLASALGEQTNQAK
jgi:hypothetical protein